MVTGRPPFQGNTPLQILMRMAQEQPPAAHLVNPKVPPEVSAIISRMMAPEFRDRYETMEAVLKDLDNVEGMTSSTAIPVVLEYPKAEAYPEGVPGRLVPVAKTKVARGKAEGEEATGSVEAGKPGRERRVPGKPSAGIRILLYLAFLAVVGGVIWFLAMKVREKNAKREGEGATTISDPAAPPALTPAPPPSSTETSGDSRPAAKKEPVKKEEPAHGRSLLGQDGDFWQKDE
jgi:hypothetical protein